MSQKPTFIYRTPDHVRWRKNEAVFSQCEARALFNPKSDADEIIVKYIHIAACSHANVVIAGIIQRQKNGH